MNQRVTANQWTEMPESWWADASKAQLVDLRERVLEAGEPMSVANSLMGFVLSGGEAASMGTRAKYRNILRDIGPPGGHAPKRRRGDRRSESGHIRQLPAIAGMAASGAVLSALPFVLPLLPQAPIILEREPQKAAQRLCRVSPLRSEPACGVSPDHLATSTRRIGRREAAECARDARRGSPAMRIEHAPAA